MNHTGKGLRFSMAALALATAGLSAQGAPPQAPPAGQPQQPPTPQAAGQQKPTYRMAIDLVTTDVIVRDSNAQFVSDLKAGDFEVFEDGIKQDLVSMILTSGGRVYNVVTPAPPRPQEGIILPPPRPVNDASGRILLLVVDDLHLDFRNTGRIRELFKKIGKQLIHDGDLFGIVSTGPSSIAQDLTYDKRRLDEALKKISGAGLKPADIINGPEGQEGPSEVRYRAHVAFSTAFDFLSNLEQVRNRRKAVIWVSDGYDFNPFEASRLGEDPWMPGRAEWNARSKSQTGDENSENATDWRKQANLFADADLARELSELTRAANRANASFYTIDPRGLVGGPDLDENLDPVEWQDYVRKSQDSLRVLAEETGGIAVVNQNDFDKALKRIDNETSDYYVIGYYSKNPDPFKRVRHIEVKVARPGLQVWSRKAYSLKPLLTQQEKR
jgi:VWFA-related protein